MKTLKRTLSIFLISLFPIILFNCNIKFNGDIEEGINLFGPEKFIKTNNNIQVWSMEIELENFEHFKDPFLIIVNNGDENGDFKSGSASVFVNDEKIFKPSDFNKKTGPLSKKLILSETSDLKVILDSKPGSYIQVTIMGWLRDDLVIDIDENIYRTVKIGNQVWMAENLKVTKYNDGTAIPLVTDATAWYNLSTPAYCWYNNDTASYKETYGALYNYYTISGGKLCPAGWHVPTDEEFRTLISTLDTDADFVRHEASFIAGGKLKETGTIHWAGPNTGATDESGFSALPGGCRSYAGSFSTLGTFGYFGSSVDESTVAVRFGTGSAFMRNKVSKYVGVSVRCIKDN